MGVKSRSVMIVSAVAAAIALAFGMVALNGSAQQSLQATATAVVVKAAPVIDQRALDLLKKMSDTLTQAKTVSFQSRSMVPVRTPAGAWINLYGDSRVVMQGPNKLYAETRGDFAPYDFYFDGKAITMYSPDKNLYAVKPAPGTIDEMIEQARKEEGKSFPYADLLVADPYDILTSGLIGAIYVGQSTFRPLSGAGSITADHLAFMNKGVEWQIWIDVKDHLPRLVCATYLDSANEPSYTVEFGDWKIDEPMNPEMFLFKNTTNAAKVEFRSPFRGRATGPAVTTNAQ